MPLYLFILKKVKVLVAQLCLSLCNPIYCGPPGSSVHGILQARILEWVAILFSRGYSWPRDRIHISCIVGGFFTIWATRGLKLQNSQKKKKKKICPLSSHLAFKQQLGFHIFSGALSCLFSLVWESLLSGLPLLFFGLEGCDDQQRAGTTASAWAKGFLLEPKVYAANLKGKRI